ncbi:MAG: bifunctional glycosyltransferase family 2/GtrA family protein [Desulfobacterales bacterium]|nr:MAG: bifunctional glycosyltransferase family 2/GtrA family protein [Desulfobacterales bacterium]
MPNHCRATLSVVIPCFNEGKTLKKCVQRVLLIANDSLKLEIVIVDDGSNDRSFSVACELQKRHPEILVLRHERNLGKGAAVRTGFKNVTGDIVAVQDADLEYDPQDLRRLLIPLVNDEADVVFGSRFLSYGAHRVLYFWHYQGNRFLTFLSNMFTDLNMTDMESGYKLFRREVIQKIEIQENGFGFEPEIVAKVAHMRLRIYEMGISYRGRAYSEGKKIGVKDGFRAIYCIFRYNAHRAPLALQLIVYLLIESLAAPLNLFVFSTLMATGFSVAVSAPTAFVAAAAVNYGLCVAILFRHKAQWSATKEIFIYAGVVGAVAVFDLVITALLSAFGIALVKAKLMASGCVLFPNFAGRRFFVFREPASGPWRPQTNSRREEQVTNDTDPVARKTTG